MIPGRRERVADMPCLPSIRRKSREQPQEMRTSSCRVQSVLQAVPARKAYSQAQRCDATSSCETVRELRKQCQPCLPSAHPLPQKREEEDNHDVMHDPQDGPSQAKRPSMYVCMHLCWWLSVVLRQSTDILCNMAPMARTALDHPRLRHSKRGGQLGKKQFEDQNARSADPDHHSRLRGW